MINSIDTPAVLVDLVRLQANIDAMAKLAAATGVQLRPHTKSHKTGSIALRQLAAGASGITVAKLDEAEAYLGLGIQDIFVANEVAGPRKYQRAAELQKRGTVAIGIDSLAAARGLADQARVHNVTIPVLIEIDTGLHRAGLAPDDDLIVELAEVVRRLEPALSLRGVFTHAGHAYGARSAVELEQIGHAEANGALEAAGRIRQHGIECPVVSVGSTPTIRCVGALPGVTEIRPGNYVFFDRMQIGLGVAATDNCSLTVLTTVVSRPSPDRTIVDAGSKTFALDKGAHGLETVQGFGDDVEHGLILSRLSEEHGVIDAQPSSAAVGDLLRFLPNHACTVTNLAEVLVGVQDGRIAEIMQVLVRGGGR